MVQGPVYCRMHCQACESFRKDVEPILPRSSRSSCRTKSPCPAPRLRGEGDRLSDYEPSQPEADDAPAAVAMHRHQKACALVLLENSSHSRSRLVEIAASYGVQAIFLIPVTVMSHAISLTCDPIVMDQFICQVSAMPGCCLFGSRPADG